MALPTETQTDALALLQEDRYIGETHDGQKIYKVDLSAIQRDNIPF